METLKNYLETMFANMPNTAAYRRDFKGLFGGEGSGVCRY